MSSKSGLSTTDGIRIVFPDEWFLTDNTACKIGGYDTRYVCNSYNETNSIEITYFPDRDILSDQEFKLTIEDLIRNPGTNDRILDAEFRVWTVTNTNDTIDSCTWIWPSINEFRTSNITTFIVDPIDKGVGNYPSMYHFELNPHGDIWPGSSIIIELPDGIEIASRTDFEQSCGNNRIGRSNNLEGFTNTLITCKYRGNKIYLYQGFAVGGTWQTLLTDQRDSGLRTPYLTWDLTGFRNPRSTETSAPWNITIVDRYEKAYYHWQVEDSPTVTMSGAASPLKFDYSRESKQNGALTNYTFNVINTNYLQDGDTL